MITEFYNTLIRHKGTSNMLLVLLTMDFKNTVPDNKLMDLLTISCSVLANCIIDNTFSEEILNEYNILNILNELLNKYFLTDYLKI
jgi:hypothetical protein